MSSLEEAALEVQGPAPAGPEERAVLGETAAHIEQLLATTSPEKRTAFLLYYVQQLELGEVAARMGTSTAAAWARIQRTRDAIIETLNGEPAQ